jgi:SulP family sulfate permease
MMMVLGRWASLVPMCCLAAVLVVVAFNMSEWRTFRSPLSAPRGDVAVLATTFGLTVVFDLTLAVQVGMVLAAFLFMKRMEDVTRIASITAELTNPTRDADYDHGADTASVRKRQVPVGVQVYEVNGPFFFGAADKLRDVLSIVDKAPRVMVLRMRHVPFMDATGLHILEQVHHNCMKSGTALVLAAVHHQPLEALKKSSCFHAIGPVNIAKNIDQALDRAQEILDTPAVPAPTHSSKKKRPRAA